MSMTHKALTASTANLEGLKQTEPLVVRLCIVWFYRTDSHAGVFCSRLQACHTPLSVQATAAEA